MFCEPFVTNVACSTDTINISSSLLNVYILSYTAYATSLTNFGLSFTVMLYLTSYETWRKGGKQLFMHLENLASYGSIPQKWVREACYSIAINTVRSISVQVAMSNVQQYSLIHSSTSAAMHSNVLIMRSVLDYCSIWRSNYVTTLTRCFGIETVFSVQGYIRQSL